MKTIIVNGQEVTFNHRSVMGIEVLAQLGVFGKREARVFGRFTTEELMFLNGEKINEAK